MYLYICMTWYGDARNIFWTGSSVDMRLRLLCIRCCWLTTFLLFMQLHVLSLELVGGLKTILLCLLEADFMLSK